MRRGAPGRSPFPRKGEELPARSYGSPVRRPGWLLVGPAEPLHRPPQVV